jgi:hypothetical protein
MVMIFGYYWPICKALSCYIYGGFELKVKPLQAVLFSVAILSLKVKMGTYQK